MRFKNLSSFSKRIIVSIIVLIFIYFLGSIGYMVIENMAFLDALFMTTITITTVGYGLVKELSTTGTIFTIILIITGTGTAAFIIINLADFLLSEFLLGRIEKRRARKMISKLKNHYIICGLGRVGLEIAHELVNNKIDFIVVDNAEEPIEIAKRNNWLYVQGDARTIKKLLQKYDILKRNVVSYHDFSKKGRTNYITGKLEAGENIALVSESGTPAIQDPGFELINECIERNITVTVVPGPNAAISALVLSGLPANNFL
ncbi:unnamed protein product, partial [marine sediment metagenome]